MKRLNRLAAILLSAVFLLACLPRPVRADAVTDTIGIYVGYYGWSEDEYREKVTFHWTDLDDWYGGALDTFETIYSYYSGSRTYLVAARGFLVRDLLMYAGIDFGSIASIDFFTKDHANGAYRSFTKYSLFNMPRYYFPNLAANEETGEIYPWDGDDIWNGATAVEAMLALEDYTEWDVVGSEFETRYDPAMLSPNCRFHLFFGQSKPEEASTSSAAKYCYKILITFSGTPYLSTEETDMTLKIGSGRKIELVVDAEDGLLTDYVREHITWTSSDDSIVSVAGDGTISVNAAGDAVITAAFGNSSVSVNVHVGEEEAPAVAPASGGSGNTGIGTGPGNEAQTATPAPAPAPVPAVTPAPAPAEEPEKEPRVPRDAPLAETEPVSGIELVLPPEEVTIRPAPGKQIFAVSPEVLAGLLQSSPDTPDQSGGKMEEDSIQLALEPPDKRVYTVTIAAALGGAFLLGFGFELGRFKRLLRGKQKR